MKQSCSKFLLKYPKYLVSSSQQLLLIFRYMLNKRKVNNSLIVFFNILRLEGMPHVGRDIVSEVVSKEVSKQHQVLTLC